MTEAAAATEAPPPEAAPVPTKTDELLKVVEDQEQPEVFQSAVDNSIGEKESDDIEDTTDEEDASNNNWKEVLPPPPPPTKPEDADEKYEMVLTSPTNIQVDETGGKGQPPAQEQQQPDFSQYKTNVARRLWEAQETAEKAGVKSSSDMVPLTREFQKYRKNMSHLIKLIDDYSEAQKVMKAKRAAVSERLCRLKKMQSVVVPSHYQFLHFLLTLAL